MHRAGNIQLTIKLGGTLSFPQSNHLHLIPDYLFSLFICPNMTLFSINPHHSG